MPRYAVFFIPRADDEFYRKGTSIVNFDVRTQQHVPMPHDFQQEWVERAQLYGFHQTICCPIDFNTGDLQSIEQDIEGTRSALPSSDPGSSPSCTSDSSY